MILSGKEIEKEVHNGNIEIEPFDPSKINPNSYNLTLHNELLVYSKKEEPFGGFGDVILVDRPLDMKAQNPTESILIPDEGLLLMPGRLYLARTVERTCTDKYVPMLEGRSSVGRLGISIHVTAGFGDIGFDGYWTLEITVAQPVIIYPGVDICQIYYHTIKGDYDIYSSGKYQNNTGIQASLMHLDFEKSLHMLNVCTEDITALSNILTEHKNKNKDFDKE